MYGRQKCCSDQNPFILARSGIVIQMMAPHPPASQAGRTVTSFLMITAKASLRWKYTFCYWLSVVCPREVVFNVFLGSLFKIVCGSKGALK